MSINFPSAAAPYSQSQTPRFGNRPAAGQGPQAYPPVRDQNPGLKESHTVRNLILAGLVFIGGAVGLKKIAPTLYENIAAKVGSVTPDILKENLGKVKNLIGESGIVQTLKEYAGQIKHQIGKLFGQLGEKMKGLFGGAAQAA